MKNFTFKKDIIGKWETGNRTTIKYDKIEVGYIVQEAWREPWRIMLKMKANQNDLIKNPNCPWVWKTVKQRFDDENKCRLWLKEQISNMIDNIYMEE